MLWCHQLWIVAVICCVKGAAFGGQIETFDLEWSGAPYSNAAHATAEITLDLSLLPNPSNGTFAFSSPLVQSFSITVTGADRGNGTFAQADYQNMDFKSESATLDFSRQLIGQPTSGSPWGTTNDSRSGDFNIFGSRHGAPDGTSFFQLTPFNSSDRIGLVSFAPHQSPVATPEPSAFVILATGFLGVGWATIRRRITT